MADIEEDNSSEKPFDNLLEDHSPKDNPPEDMAVSGVQTGKLMALPLFDRERREAFVNSLKIIENAKATYNWTDDSVASVVRSKGGPKVYGNCIHRKAKLKHTHVCRLVARFGPKYTTSTVLLYY